MNSPLPRSGGLPAPGNRLGAAEADGERQLQQLGRQLIVALFAALRALKLYPLDNQTVQKALAELEDAAARIWEREGSVVLRYVEDLCFVNDVRLRIDLGSYATYGAVARALQRHGVGQMEIERGASRTEWIATLSLLLGEPDAQDPYGRLAERVERSAVRQIRLLPQNDPVLDSDAFTESREVARRTFTHSVAAVRELMLGIRMGKGVGIRRVKRAVQMIIDQVLNNEGSILGMTALRDYDEYTFTHSVNVCIFSVALGKKLGFSRKQLYDLGMGALLHDIGKLRMPLEIINKPSKLSDEEWQMVREHPTEGFLSLFGMRGFSEIPLRPMLMAYEHHLKADNSGYPACKRERSRSLFGRIVAVADGFDAATTVRSYQSEPWPPDQVLREMRDNPERGCDPLLVKAFISLTGIYPPGSLVILDTFELAVVVAPTRDPAAINQPVVRIIHNDMGVPLDPPLTIDLAEAGQQGKRRTIIKTTDPQRYGINVSDYVV